MTWYKINQISNNKTKCASNGNATLTWLAFTALKVYRLKRQLLWQQSVTTILSNVPSSSLLIYMWYQYTLMLSTLRLSFSQKDIGKDEIIVERMNYWICERIICSNLSNIVVPYYQSYSQPKFGLIFIFFPAPLKATSLTLFIVFVTLDVY